MKILVTMRSVREVYRTLKRSDKEHDTFSNHSTGPIASRDVTSQLFRIHLTRPQPPIAVVQSWTYADQALDGLKAETIAKFLDSGGNVSMRYQVHGVR
jgi:hypothetical protein